MRYAEPKEYIVEVTQEDIECGSKGEGKSCPIALSLARLFPEGAGQFEVGEDYIEDEKGFVLSNLPLTATHFIQAFDVDAKVEPFEFPITVWEVPS